MGVLASGSITLAVAVDVASVDTWYALVLSGSSQPSHPETAEPEDWYESEPVFDGTSTGTLYTCQKTTLTDGTFYWGAVSVSTSYEAAKQAWNIGSAAADGVSALQDGLESANADLGQLAEEVAAKAGADDLDALAQAVSDQADELADKATKAELADYYSALEMAEASIGLVAGDLNGLLTRVTVDENGVTVSSTEDGAEKACSLRLTESEIAFQGADGEKVAYVGVDESGGSVFYVERAIIADNMRIGNWQWTPRANRNLCLKWRG